MAEWFDLSNSDDEVNRSIDIAILSRADEGEDGEDPTDQMFEISSQQLYEEGMRIITNMQNNLMSQLQEDNLRNLINQANMLLADVGDRLRTYNQVISQIPTHSGKVQPHTCCKLGENPSVGMLTRKRKHDSGVRQVDLKCRFPHMKSKTIDFFNKHTCCVCLETYKDVIEGDNHIVVPPCGHPLCCKCADNILVRKPECPICKVKVTKNIFQLMKFDKDSHPDLKKQKVYL